MTAYPDTISTRVPWKPSDNAPYQFVRMQWALRGLAEETPEYLPFWRMHHSTRTVSVAIVRHYRAPALLDDRVIDPPRNVAFDVRAVGSVDHGETKSSDCLIDCGEVKPAFDGDLIDGARDRQFTVVRWPHLDQWD